MDDLMEGEKARSWRLFYLDLTSLSNLLPYPSSLSSLHPAQPSYHTSTKKQTSTSKNLHLTNKNRIRGSIYPISLPNPQKNTYKPPISQSPSRSRTPRIFHSIHHSHPSPKIPPFLLKSRYISRRRHFKSRPDLHLPLLERKSVQEGLTSPQINFSRYPSRCMEIRFLQGGDAILP
jgi:hypothetical protein